MDFSGFDAPGFGSQSASTAVAPAQPHFARGLGGVAERFLPAIGSIAGAVGGSFLAPGVGTAAGGAGGAVAGQKLEDFLTGHHTSAGGYAGQAALGTLGGVGRAFGAIKGATNLARAGEGSGALNALRFGTGSAVDSVASGGKTALGSASQGAKSFGNKILSTGAQGFGTGAGGKALTDALPQVTSKMADYGFHRPATWEQAANKVTGQEGVLNTVKNQIIGRAEKNGAAVNLEGWRPLDLATPRGGGYSGSFINRGEFNANTADPTSVVTKAIEGNNLAFDKQGANTVWKAAKNVSQKVSDSGNAPTVVFDQIKALEAQASKAYQAGKQDVGGAFRDISKELRDRLDSSIGHEPVTSADVGKMVKGLTDNGVTNPNLLRDIKGLTGAPALGIRGVEKTFVDASHIGAATRRATTRQLGAEVNRSGFLGLGGVMNALVERPVLGIGRQVVGQGARGIGNILGKASTTGEGLGTTAKSVAKTQALVRASGALLGGAAQSQPQDQTQSAQQPDLSAVESLPGFTGGQNQTTGQTSDQSQTPFTADNIQRAILSDLATNGGKNVSTLVSLYNTFGSPKAQKAASGISTTEANNLDYFNRASASLGNYANQLQGAGGPQGPLKGEISSFAGKFGLGGQTAAKANALQNTKLETATAIAKALTGSARPAANIIEQWKSALPGVTDAPQVAQQKLNFILQSIKAQADVQRNYPSTAGAAPPDSSPTQLSDQLSSLSDQLMGAGVGQ